MCCLAVIFFKSPASFLSLCLLLDFLHRQGQFLADQKVNTLSEPSQVSLSCIRHLPPSVTLCHPHCLSVCLSCLTLFTHLFPYHNSSKLPASFHDIPASHPSSLNSIPFKLEYDQSEKWKSTGNSWIMDELAVWDMQASKQAENNYFGEEDIVESWPGLEDLWALS